MRLDVELQESIHCPPTCSLLLLGEHRHGHLCSQEIGYDKHLSFVVQNHIL